MPVEPVRPRLLRQQGDNFSGVRRGAGGRAGAVGQADGGAIVPAYEPQSQAEGIVGGQRRQIDALGIGQSAEQLVLAGMAEVDVVVDLGPLGWR